MSCFDVELALALESDAREADVGLRVLPGLGACRGKVILEVPETPEAVLAARQWLRDLSFELGSLELSLAQLGAVESEAG